MAARSFILALRRITNRTSTIHTKSLSSDALRTATLAGSVSEPESSDSDDLKGRIFRLWLPIRSATNVIQRWISEGNRVSLSQLRDISKDLCKLQRYKHAFEISEWIVSHDEFKLSDSDYAIRIDLMEKVLGIDAAERYFKGLPDTAKTSETYTALLHSYAGAKLTDKAEQLLHRMKDSGISFTAVAYNEMMTLYMSVGQPDKVNSVIEELKRKNFIPDLFTYNLWISSRAAMMDIDGARAVLEEMSRHSSLNQSWVRYRNLVEIYLIVGQLGNSRSRALIGTEPGTTQREWIMYDLLVMLQAGLGNKDKIDRIWRSLRMTKQKMISRNYMCVLSSYLMLGYMKEVVEVVDQWKQSAATAFDDLLCDRLIEAFSQAGFGEKAEVLRSILSQKACDGS